KRTHSVRCGGCLPDGFGHGVGQCSVGQDQLWSIGSIDDHSGDDIGPFQCKKGTKLISNERGQWKCRPVRGMVVSSALGDALVVHSCGDDRATNKHILLDTRAVLSSARDSLTAAVIFTSRSLSLSSHGNTRHLSTRVALQTDC